jgi:RecA-family ATPase
MTSIDDSGPLITYTVFQNVQAREKTEYADAAWTDLVKAIAEAPTYIAKASCPLLSLCEYGDLVSDGGGLRHSANVKRVFGVEVDYDGEEVSPEEAQKRLQAAGLMALIYTSASYTDGAPRWRALLPLSEPSAPTDRARFVARANRALLGIATRESFTLSQSFYFGKVRGAKYIVLEAHGRCVDQAVDIEPLFFVGGTSDPKTGRDTRSNQELLQCFERGEGRYEAMLKLTSRWAARGMAYDDIVAAMNELLDSSGSSLNGDGIDLRSRIEPMAQSAVRKFGGTMPEVRLQSLPQPPAGRFDDSPDWSAFPEAQGLERTYPQADESVKATKLSDSESIVARRWQPIEADCIPPRQWLYGFHYMRRMVSMTAGAGGGGKSSMTMVEAVSMALGRDLLRGKWQLPTGALKVWIHNGEDPLDELQRRLVSICKHYSLDPQEVAQNLYLTSGRDTRIIVAEETDGTVMQLPAVREQIVRCALDEQIDAMILDPFISTHAVNENNNPAMEKVMWEWRAIAEQANLAVEIVHHFRKGNGNEASSEDVRGASALLGACRSVRIASPMGQPEAEKYGIEAKDRRRYFWLQNPKANMRPPTDERLWRQLVSIDLGNGDAVYPDGDKVGVVDEWNPPTDSQMSPGQKAVILADIDATYQRDPLLVRADVRSAQWAGQIVAKHMELDVHDAGARSMVRRVLDEWVTEGSLVKVSARDHAKGRYISALKVGDKKAEADEVVPF